MMTREFAKVKLFHSKIFFGSMVFRMLRSTQVGFFLCLFFSASLSAENWPQWRGPDGQGRATTMGVPWNWSETENIKWKTEIPGLGWSSCVVFGDQIWMTATEAVEASEEEKAKRKKTITNSQPVEIVAQINMFAICLDKSSGKLLHKIELMVEEHPDPIHHQNSYASPSPLIEEGRLYCHFGTHGTACVDTESAKVLWTNQEIHLNHENGPGSSPVLHGEHIIFHCDGSDVQFIAAIHKHTGKIAWTTDRTGKLNSNPQLQKSYCTPLVIVLDGKAQLVSPAADWVYGYDPESGKELWKVSYGGLGFSNSARPVYDNGLIYICTGFMKSRLLAIRHDEHTPEPSVAWSFEKQVATVSSPLTVNGLMFFVSDAGIASCLNARTGDVHWQKRIGGNHWASPIYVDGHVLFSNKSGETTVLRASPDFEIVSRNQLDGVIMASPAAMDGALILRTDKAVYWIDD